MNALASRMASLYIANKGNNIGSFSGTGSSVTTVPTLSRRTARMANTCKGQKLIPLSYYPAFCSCCRGILFLSLFSLCPSSWPILSPIWKLQARSFASSRAQGLPPPSTNSAPSIFRGNRACGKFNSHPGSPRMKSPQIERLIADEVKRRAHLVRACRRPWHTTQCPCQWAFQEGSYESKPVSGLSRPAWRFPVRRGLPALQGGVETQYPRRLARRARQAARAKAASRENVPRRRPIYRKLNS